MGREGKEKGREEKGRKKTGRKTGEGREGEGTEGRTGPRIQPPPWASQNLGPALRPETYGDSLSDGFATAIILSGFDVEHIR